MTDQRHEWIQRWSDGQLDKAETAALQQALRKDPALRSWYLDYMNLDAALRATATSVSEASGAPLVKSARTVVVPRQSYSPWTLAACLAAGLAILIFIHSEAVRPVPDIVTATAAAHEAIKRARIETPPPIPAWMSPTKPLLGQR